MPATLRRIACAACVPALLAGCAISDRMDYGELRSDPRAFFNLNPPIAYADASAAGTEVVLKRGQVLVLRLPEDASSGMAWRMRPLATGPVVAPVQHDLTASPGIDPAKPGGPGEATFRLRGVAAGTQPIALDYVRTGFVQPERSLAFDVTVR